jgi:hypothetical protein
MRLDKTKQGQVMTRPKQKEKEVLPKRGHHAGCGNSRLLPVELLNGRPQLTAPKGPLGNSELATEKTGWVHCQMEVYRTLDGV